MSLGRIVVHDRIKVEAHVLPKYFNHCSFASLRRQLNYFKFVRLGKGRQLESTYVNDCVVDLDDVLTLKRRSTSLLVEQRLAVKADPRSIDETVVTLLSKGTMPLLTTTTMATEDLTEGFAEDQNSMLETETKQSVSDHPTATANKGQKVLVGSGYDDHQEILAGCQALLGLSGKEWNPHS